MKILKSYYACLYFEAENTDSFSIYYNESLTSGRYLPNMDAKTMAWKNPPLTYVPALTTRGTVLAFGDNRMTDLASKVQNAVVGNDRLIPDTIHLKPFPFEKARCDGVGCVMKYSWPAMIGSVFFITIQTFLTRVGLEKKEASRRLCICRVHHKPHIGCLG